MSPYRFRAPIAIGRTASDDDMLCCRSVKGVSSARGLQTSSRVVQTSAARAPARSYPEHRADIQWDAKIDLAYEGTTRSRRGPVSSARSFAPAASAATRGSSRAARHDTATRSAPKADMVRHRTGGRYRRCGHADRLPDGASEEVQEIYKVGSHRCGPPRSRDCI